MQVPSHRDLVVWQKAMDLVFTCYQITRQFPKSETYGLASQLQRAAVSVPSNIAEGKARGSTNAYLNHLSIAAGSLAEFDTQIELASRLGYLGPGELERFQMELDTVGKMLTGLRKSLKNYRDRKAAPQNPKS